MDGARLNSLIYKGRAKAGQRIGLPCQAFRPNATGSPFTNPIASISVAINSGDSTYTHPNKYNDAIWYADFDASLTQVGDYIVRLTDNSNWFIAGQQPLLQIILISCNRVVNCYRPQQEPGVGAVGYGGNVAALQTPIVTGYPASILASAKTERSTVNLPGDVKSAFWSILLPKLPGGAYLRGDDVITDDEDRRYVISSAELTDLGYRINAYQAET